MSLRCGPSIWTVVLLSSGSKEKIDELWPVCLNINEEHIISTTQIDFAATRRLINQSLLQIGATCSQQNHPLDVVKQQKWRGNWKKNSRVVSTSGISRFLRCIESRKDSCLIKRWNKEEEKEMLTLLFEWEHTWQWWRAERMRMAVSSGAGPASWTHRWWRPQPGTGRSGCSWEKGLGTIPSWSQTCCTRTWGSSAATCSHHGEMTTCNF